MKKKTSIILHSSLFLLAQFSGLLLTRIDPNFFHQIGVRLGYEQSALLIICLSIALVISISYIFLTKTENKQIPRVKKANPLLRLYNLIHYPICIWYNDFWWKINKDSQNNFVVSLPLCPACCKQIIWEHTEFNGKYICPCGNNFSSYNFEENEEFILNQLCQEGIKSFEKVSKRNPC
jgi:hypothetical protein